VRIEGLRDYGAALSPFNAFQIIQGLETLPIRVQKHSENGLACLVVRNTRSGGMGKLPGLKSSKYYDLAKEYLQKDKMELSLFLREVLKRLRLLLMKRKYFHF
jgi:O-acetylhomoserine (thiol)-lyase